MTHLKFPHHNYLKLSVIFGVTFSVDHHLFPSAHIFLTVTLLHELGTNWPNLLTQNEIIVYQRTRWHKQRLLRYLSYAFLIWYHIISAIVRYFPFATSFVLFQCNPIKMTNWTNKLYFILKFTNSISIYISFIIWSK